MNVVYQVEDYQVRAVVVTPSNVEAVRSAVYFVSELEALAFLRALVEYEIEELKARISKLEDITYD